MSGRLHVPLGKREGKFGKKKAIDKVKKFVKVTNGKQGRYIREQKESEVSFNLHIIYPNYRFLTKST